VLLTKVTLVAALLPKFTVAPFRKLAPVIVTVVPPAVGPNVGEMLLMVGAGFWANVTRLTLMKTA
jgi:hypothetical protein